MIHLELDSQKKEVLASALESYLADMSFGIADTDNMEFRNEKAKRDILKTVLDAVREAT